LLLLGILVVALGAGAILYLNRAKNRGVREEVAELRHEAKVLDMKAEALIGELANLRVERNVLRENLADLQTRNGETAAALAKALADLAAVRKERDEHLAKRLDLDRRLEDALSLIAGMTDGE
jgi:septal ring factor EnvC (AmiA/AmiB activator)